MGGSSGGVRGGPDRTDGAGHVRENGSGRSDGQTVLGLNFFSGTKHLLALPPQPHAGGRAGEFWPSQAWWARSGVSELYPPLEPPQRPNWSVEAHLVSLFLLRTVATQYTISHSLTFVFAAHHLPFSSPSFRRRFEGEARNIRRHCDPRGEVHKL